ncbi:unnamed protein product [Rotaria magnacalcarata]|uniref:Uncharacterized protein n=1 Tax=Rotaria magnacalcarata TaxID=392030 RepID=A0A819ZNS6_9BILA|nr:unnamed protein product [Rotaria magnacalcarata]
MMHLCESRKVHHSYINIINRLGRSFVIDFPTLYSKRHCVQVVHSIIHISDTVRDFGPLQSFSTFQFENELDNDEPYLLVAYLRDLNPLTCAINVNEKFAYPNILYTSTSKWNFTPIEVKDFIEKSTFFRSTADISYFLRFPTLEHCS